MVELNHFAISAALGSTLGPTISVHHGQIASAGLAASLSQLLQRRKPYIDELTAHDDLTTKYEKAVTQAFLHVRHGYSSDRVLADPDINRDFIKECRNLGLDDTPFHLNLALIGLRKHNKLKAKSKKSVVRNQSEYAVASEIAARTMFYRHHASVDTTLANPKFAAEFDRLASSITPNYTSFEYRWAALNIRKKGANVKIKPKVMEELDWSKRISFDADSVPSDEGVYSLFERETCLFVAGADDIQSSISEQRRIADIQLFDPHFWRPNPASLRWQYALLPDSTSDYRFGVVRSLVGEWKPIFNIPRGKKAA